MSKKTYIYILRLEENHYFIGKSNHVENRLKDHIKGIVCGFTKRYKPLAITVIPNCDESELDLYVKKFMIKYGINKIRGGIYMDNKFSDSVLKQIKTELEILSKHSMIKLPVMPQEFPIIQKEQINTPSKQSSKQSSKPPSNPPSNPQAKAPVKKDIVLKIPIKNANGTCYNCGKAGHYLQNCKKPIINNDNTDDETETESEIESELDYDDIFNN